MAEVVLDSSVIVKAVLRPGSWLPRHVYEREKLTRDRAKTLIRLTSVHGATVLITYPVLGLRGLLEE